MQIPMTVILSFIKVHNLHKEFRKVRLIKERKCFFSDYAIVDILDSKSTPLRYHELAKEIERHCKISSSTLTLHLKRLAGRKIVERRLFANGHTTYALTIRFKEISEIQREKYSTDYWEMAFGLEPFDKDTFEFGIPEVPKPRFKTYWLKKKDKKKTIMDALGISFHSFTTICNLPNISGFKFCKTGWTAIRSFSIFSIRSFTDCNSFSFRS